MDEDPRRRSSRRSRSPDLSRLDNKKDQEEDSLPWASNLARRAETRASEGTGCEGSLTRACVTFSTTAPGGLVASHVKVEAAALRAANKVNSFPSIYPRDFQMGISDE